MSFWLHIFNPTLRITSNKLYLLIPPLRITSTQLFLLNPFLRITSTQLFILNPSLGIASTQLLLLNPLLRVISNKSNILNPELPFWFIDLINELIWIWIGLFVEFINAFKNWLKKYLELYNILVYICDSKICENYLSSLNTKIMRV